MTFTRTIVEQNRVPYNVLQRFHKHSRTFLEHFRVVLEHSSIKLKNYSRIVPDHFAGVQKYSRNINLLTYVNLRSVHMTYILCSWSIITYK